MDSRVGHVAAAARHKELRACTGQSSVLAHGEGEALPLLGPGQVSASHAAHAGTRTDGSAQNPDGSQLSFQQLHGWRGCSLRCLPGARVEAAVGGSEGDLGCRLRDTYLEPFAGSAARHAAQPRVCISVRICSQAASGERGRSGLRFLAHKPAAAAPPSHTAARGERHGEAGVAPPAAPRLASPPGQGSCRPLAPCAEIKKAKTHLSELAALSKS